MACGIATLKTLKESNPYPHLEAESQRLITGLAEGARKAGLEHSTAQVGSMFTLFFNPQPVTNYTVAAKSDTKRFSRYFWGMIERGVYLPCSQFEANFLSTAHTKELVDTTIRAAEVLREDAAGSTTL